MAQIRTRIAPSPTGEPHVGTAYIALFNRCFAHQHGGKFILRVEDTDQVRSTAKSEQRILDSLNWLGLDWDEGPDRGGEFEPYRQSERAHIYTQHIDQLLEEKKVFRCFCSSSRLSVLHQNQMEKKQQPGYDGHCLKFTDQQIAEKLEKGEKHVIRMTKPENGECVFQDYLRGEICISWNQVDMQILIKSDGLPTYHFANVVDDHLMEISHVIRGEEWINSTPKHLLIYQYFGWEPPIFCHMPLLRNPDKSKLSKRKNPTSISYYRAMGYLPQALLNYLGNMGWSLPSGEEKFTFEEMVKKFDLERVSLGGPIFDIEKLDWLNGKYIREDLSDRQFMELFADWAFAPDRTEKIAGLIKQRVERFSDVAEIGAFFLTNIPDTSRDSFNHKTLDLLVQVKILQFSLWRLEQLEEWDKKSVEEVLQELANALEIKIRDFLFPLFVAISGKAISTSVFESIAILGLDICRARLRHAVGVLGGTSKKQLKSYEKEYRDLV